MWCAANGELTNNDGFGGGLRRAEECVRGGNDEMDKGVSVP
jgi:hypothetical protein